MDTTLKFKYLKHLNRLQGKDYLAATISFGAAPTIKGKKPASLLAFTVWRKNLLALWHCYKEELCRELDLDFFELRDGPESVTVLFYRRKMLEKHIALRRNQDFLNSVGYQETATLAGKLQLLKKRFACTCTHEVGIFLGIPVDDVVGFMENKGKNYLLCRYWKVYQNRERAELLFKIYDEARSNMARAVVNRYERINPEKVMPA